MDEVSSGSSSQGAILRVSYDPLPPSGGRKNKHRTFGHLQFFLRQFRDLWSGLKKCRENAGLQERSECDRESVFRFRITSSCLTQPLKCWDHGCVSLHTDQYAVLPWHSFPYNYMLWCGLNFYIFYLFVLWMSPTVYPRISSNAWAQAHVCLQVAKEINRSHGVQFSLKCASLCSR